MLVDTHCHLNICVKSEFDRLLTTNEIAAAELLWSAAAEHGVSTIINVGTSLIESKNCITLAEKYSGCYATIGIHPCDGKTTTWESDIASLERLIEEDTNKRIVGIGECGLDYYHPGYDKPFQRKLFRTQIELAIRYKKGLSVHTRSAGDEVIAILEEYGNEVPRAVIHCFSEDSAAAVRARALGAYLGIGGTITYPKNESLRAAVRAVGLTGIVLETDAPYLPPQHMRGKKNTAGEVATVAQYCAELFGVSCSDVAAITSANARALFNLPATAATNTEKSTIKNKMGE
jgi:TatD DNase family protein